jgi:hypothetical protein
MNLLDQMLADAPAKPKKAPRVPSAPRVSHSTANLELKSLQDTLRGANTFSARIAEMSNRWKWTRRITLVQHQTCQCCGSEVSAITFNGVERSNPYLRATECLPFEPFDVETRDLGLPLDIQYADVTVPECVTCLTLGAIFRELGCQNPIPQQFTLF